MARLDVVYVNVRPDSTLPLASRAVAVNTCVPPTATAAVAGLSETAATGGCRIVTVTVPDLPSLVAVTVAVPAAKAVTRPVVLTLAFVESEVVQLTTRDRSTAPLASSVDAANCCVPPRFIAAGTAGVTTTLATGTGMTVSVIWPDLLPAVAVMLVCPGATAVIAPPEVIVATVGEDDDQVTVPVEIDAPFWSAPVAFAVAV